MLSFISSIYDPLGIASPFILPGRQILQRLCLINYDWDEEIPEEELSTWNVWQQSLAQLLTVAVPRCVKLNLAEKLRDVQLHTFADASRLGYGAVSYLRLVDVNNQLTVSFLVGKSRVTPTKQVTIPRLELTAAVLAVKLSHQVEEELEISVDRIVFWTDSTVVLQYLNNESTCFQTFVANRLAIIHDQSTITDRLRKQYIQWHFNPPAASHMGGIWERIICSIRRILKALLQGQRVNDESLVTFMAETEIILNERPLTRQEDHPNDLEPLTPNKLLLLRSEQPPPLGSWVVADKFSKRWRQAQQLASAFWKRWVKEYLPLLQERQKWLTVKRNLQPKDLVLLLDERLCREQWPLGIVEEVYPDKNGRVRQVLVRTSKSKFKRDIRKLCLLEGDC